MITPEQDLVLRILSTGKDGIYRGLVPQAPYFQTIGIYDSVHVAIRRLDTTTVNGLAYISTVKDGVGTIHTKRTPFHPRGTLTKLLDVDVGLTDLICEFNGYWEMDYAKRRHNFITELEPQLFYIKSGELFTRTWTGEPISLATGVTKMAALRGWLPASGDQFNDQGLIVAYLKTNGAMYYRNYCIQADTTKAWEIERPVTPFASMVDNLALFRTNDFRVGFVAEIAGETYWTLTPRNYAGMSVWPEHITTAITDLVFEVLFLPPPTDGYEAERITASIDSISLLVCRPIDPTIVSISNLANDYNLKVTFSHAVSGGAVGHEGKCILTDANATNFAINATSAGANGAELMISCVNFASAKNPMTLTHLGGLTCNNDGCEFDVPIGATSFTANIEPPKGYATESITTMIQPTFTVTQIYYRSAYTDERITAAISAISFVVTKVGANPL